MLIKLYEQNIDERQVKKIVYCLKNGGVIIYPTDTVYAFGCDLYNKKAIERISKLKFLPENSDKYTLICENLSHLSDFCAQISNPTFKVMKRLLPGAFTFILKANTEVPKLFRSNKKTVGIRVPDNAIAQKIVQELGNPLVSSSLFNADDDIEEYLTDPELIYEKYNHLVDMVIDGGFGNNEPSTILDCTADEGEIVVVRQGKGVFIA